MSKDITASSPAGTRRRGRRSPIGTAIRIATTGLLVVAVTGSSLPHASPPAPVATRIWQHRSPTPLPTVPPVPVPAPVLARLPRVTTDGRLTGVAVDPTPDVGTAGTVAHPTDTIPVYSVPGGPAVAALPPTQLGHSPTWLPVTATRPGWLGVLLPTRPNHSTGWISSTAVEQAHTDYTITVALGAHRLTVYRHGRPVGSWPTSAGKPSTPTPTGRTFLLAEVAETRTHYSPLIWPLGTHSTSLDTFGGGPGTVAIHGWPDPAVFGHDASSGCVRIPAAGLHVLTGVPLGSLVTITH